MTCFFVLAAPLALTSMALGSQEGSVVVCDLPVKQWLVGSTAREPRDLGDRVRQYAHHIDSQPFHDVLGHPGHSTGTGVVLCGRPGTNPHMR